MSVVGLLIAALVVAGIIWLLMETIEYLSEPDPWEDHED